MAAFLFALLAVLAAGLGARDQVLMARMAGRGSVLAIGLICALLTTTAAGWAGHTVAPLINAPARAMLVAMALGFAALELIFVQPDRKPLEPTQSLGAFTVVILAQQLTDAARFTVFAIAAASAVPWVAVSGGALGSAASVLAGWLGGSDWEAQPLGTLRRGLGLLLLLVTIYLAYPVLAARIAA